MRKSRKNRARNKTLGGDRAVKVDPWVAHQASVECFRNAEAFIDDARTLVGRGSHGHGIALLVLAEEELGKSFLWGLSAMGIPVPRRLLRSHRAKQAVKLLIFDLIGAYVVQVISYYKEAKAAHEGWDQQLLVQDALERLQKKTTKHGLPLEGVTTEDMDRLGVLDRLKQRGWYVEVSPDGKVSSPRSFGRQEAEDCLNRLEVRYRGFREILNIEEDATERDLASTREDLPEDVREAMLRFVASLDEAEKRR